MTYHNLFSSMWRQYININPTVEKIYKLLKNDNLNLVNDHIAIRSIDLEGLRVEDLGKYFEKYGYAKMQTYYFEEKKLVATHFEHSDENAPRVFISHLETKKFSPYLQDTMHNIFTQVQIKGEELLFSGRSWGGIYHDVYQKLLKESEYAAWLYCFGFCANHFTVNVNSLSKHSSIEELNLYLKEQGYQLSSKGGEVKGSEEQGLKQSSTLADPIEINFIEGVFKVPSVYYEFAERFVLPSGHKFSGFVESSADKIFESTNVKK